MSSRLAICSLVTALAIAEAQSPSWDELNQQATRLQQEGMYADAKALFLRALQQVGNGVADDPRIPITFNNLASVCQDLGDIATAKRYYEQTIAAFERINGKEHPVLAKPLHNLAALLLEQGQFAGAERLRRRALALHSGSEGLTEADTTMIRHGLASAILAQGRNREAEAIYLQILARGVSAREAAELHNDLAVLYAQTARRQEAVSELLQVISTLEQTVGTNHPALLRPLSNLAVVWSIMGQHDKAEPILRRALSLAATAYGEGAVYGWLLETQAVVLRKLRRTTEAKDAEKRAKVILSAMSRDTSLRYTVDIGDLLRISRKRH